MDREFQGQQRARMPSVYSLALVPNDLLHRPPFAPHVLPHVASILPSRGTLHLSANPLL